MMLHTVDDVTSCWCAPSADLTVLDQEYPTEAGAYQVLDISELKIGAVSSVQYPDGFEVTSTNLANDYCTFTSELPGK